MLIDKRAQLPHVIIHEMREHATHGQLPQQLPDRTDTDSALSVITKCPPPHTYRLTAKMLTF